MPWVTASPSPVPDVVRKQLAGLAPTDTARAEHYTQEFSERTYERLLTRTREASDAGAPAVLLDGNFPTPAHRATAAAAAAAAGATPIVVFVDVDAATAIARAAARRDEPDNVSDADPAITQRLHDRFTPPDAGDAMVLRLDGAHATDDLAASVLAHLLSIST
jgi:predicted kinase